MPEIPPSEEMIIKVPSLRTGKRAFEFFGQAYEDGGNYSGFNICFDFTNVNWIDAHLCAPFMCVVRLLESKRNRIRFRGVKNNVKGILYRNGFFDSDQVSEAGTVMPLMEFSKGDGVIYSDYVRRNLDRMHLPSMSAALRNKIYEGVDEVFINSSMHSYSETNIHFCGQFFPKLNEISFSVTDGGVGMCGSYNRAFRRNIQSLEAIDWAMEGQNTTRSGDVPGGLGLKILREFLRLNGGQFLVVSRWGYWNEKHDKLERAGLSTPFPGTAIIMKINAADTQNYELASAPDPRDIW